VSGGGGGGGGGGGATNANAVPRSSAERDKICKRRSRQNSAIKY